MKIKLPSSGSDRVIVDHYSLDDESQSSGFLSAHSTSHSKLSTFGAALAIVSSCIGGGVVGLAFAFYNVGIPMATILLVIVGLQTLESIRLYLAAKDLIPGQPESMYEIGYILFKRSSIFMISAVLMLNSFGSMLVYFIVFGDTLSSLMINLSYGQIDDESLLGQRGTYVIMLAVLLTPVVLKKELKEI
jgi:amino acid permease